jgi:hypothetical protein
LYLASIYRLFQYFVVKSMPLQWGNIRCSTCVGSHLNPRWARICLLRIIPPAGEYLRGKCHCTFDLLFDWFLIRCVTPDIFVFICKTD